MVIWNVVGYAMCRRCNTSHTKNINTSIIHFNLINVKISISWKHPSNNVSYKILIMVHLLMPFYEKGCFFEISILKIDLRSWYITFKQHIQGAMICTYYLLLFTQYLRTEIFSYF